MVATEGLCRPTGGLGEAITCHEVTAARAGRFCLLEAQFVEEGLHLGRGVGVAGALGGSKSGVKAGDGGLGAT